MHALQGPQEDEVKGLLLGILHGALPVFGPDVLSHALQVGAWGFLANAATVSGFQNTAASRGAFLIRLSAIMTPLIASLAGVCILQRARLPLELLAHWTCRLLRIHRATHMYDCVGEAISLRIWAGCVAALAGGVLMTLSHSGPDAASAFSGLAAGDGLLIGAALLWSIQVWPLTRLVHNAKHGGVGESCLRSRLQHAVQSERSGIEPTNPE